MASISATTAQANQPRVTTDGTLITRMQSYVTTASLSAGDTITLHNLKIPAGATVRSMYVKAAGANAEGVFHLTMGDTTSAAWGGSVTAASGVIAYAPAPSAYGYLISVSDSATTRYKTIMASVTTHTSSTVSTSLMFVVDYTMDP